MYMAKKKIRHVVKAHVKKAKAKVVAVKKAAAPQNKSILTVIRGWMFVVAFALMLGIGAVVGTYFNKLLNENTPTVAGAQIQVNR
jgi:hypothetical protein